jgi:tetratricopeptide (TPR) repeat protein
MQNSGDLVGKLDEGGHTSAPSELDQSQSDAVRFSELEAMFDAFLPDATLSERSQIAAFQADLHLQQRRLAGFLADRVIGVVEHARAVNQEINWCFRRGAAILGSERFQRLFGVDIAETERLVDEQEALARADAEAEEDALSDIMSSVSQLVMRYTPTEAEQECVVRAFKTIDPQKRESISEVRWAPRSRYAGFIKTISDAEMAYREGELDKSILSAKAVLEGISKLTEMTDTPLYLAAWSHHIQGRGYEALMNWRAACLHYEASLAVKMKLSWLPVLLVFPTEIKLGVVEMLQSPVESATRLLRVTEVLNASGDLARENRRLYQNLLEDSAVALAEAYLEMGETSRAADQAKIALELAETLNDRVGAIRSLYVLFRASAESKKVTRRKIKQFLDGAPQAASHPRVAFILGVLDRETKEKG